MKIAFRLFALGLGLVLSSRAASLSAPASPAIIAPFANVVAYAAVHQIALSGVEVSEPTIVARRGDSITALVAFRGVQQSKQWLIQFQIAIPTEKELKANPPPGMWAKSDSSGRTYHYGAGTILALDIRTAGPFVEGGNPPTSEKSARAFISPDFLGLGLDRTCQLMLKVVADRASVAPGKNPSPVVLSEADERIYFGFGPALITFFQGVQNTPGLRDILWEIADKPSVWSIIKRGGKVDIHLNMEEMVTTAEPAGWAPSGLPLYRVPFMVDLNDQRSLRCALLVTSPRVPLLTTAGIVGIAAESPENSDRRLDVRIVAAHRAPL